MLSISCLLLSLTRNEDAFMTRGKEQGGGGIPRASVCGSSACLLFVHVRGSTDYMAAGILLEGYPGLHIQPTTTAATMAATITMVVSRITHGVRPGGGAAPAGYNQPRLCSDRIEEKKALPWIPCLSQAGQGPGPCQRGLSPS